MSKTLFENFCIEFFYRLVYIFVSLALSVLSCFCKYPGFFFLFVSPMNYHTLFSSWDLFFLTPLQQVFSILLVYFCVCFIFVSPLFFLHGFLFFYCFFYFFEQRMLSFLVFGFLFFILNFEFLLFLKILPAILVSFESFRSSFNSSLFFVDFIPSVFSYVSFCGSLVFFLFLFSFIIFLFLFFFITFPLFFLKALKFKKLFYYSLFLVVLAMIPPDFFLFAIFSGTLFIFFEVFLLYVCIFVSLQFSNACL